MNLAVSLDIKRRRLAEEMRKPHPNKFIVKRLQEKIRHHEKQLAVRRKAKRRFKE